MNLNNVIIPAFRAHEKPSIERILKSVAVMLDDYAATPEHYRRQLGAISRNRFTAMTALTKATGQTGAYPFALMRHFSRNVPMAKIRGRDIILTEITKEGEIEDRVITDFELYEEAGDQSENVKKAIELNTVAFEDYCDMIMKNSVQQSVLPNDYSLHGVIEDWKESFGQYPFNFILVPALTQWGIRESELKAVVFHYAHTEKEYYYEP